jgi:hypothetical protein
MKLVRNILDRTTGTVRGLLPKITVKVPTWAIWAALGIVALIGLGLIL